MINRNFKDGVAYGLIYLATAFTVGILFLIIGFIFYNGIGKINLGFFSNEYNSKTSYVVVNKKKEDNLNKKNYINDLGIDIKKNNKGMYIITNIDKNSPLKNAKTKAGRIVVVKKDNIINKIDDQEIKNLNINQIKNLVSNSKGNTVLLKVVNPGEGVYPMIVTTLLIILISLVVAVPIGIFSAIYLVEYAKQGRLVKIIRFSVESLAGIPSIIYGLFGMIFFVVILKFNYSILSGALTISIILLPTIIRTTEESLKTVPNSYREGSLGLGATKLQTIWKVILPSAVSGILTAVILSIGRIIGESAALLLTAGTVARIPKSLFSSGSTLTVKAYEVAKEEGNIQMACAIGIVIIILILILNVLSKFVSYIFNKKRMGS